MTAAPDEFKQLLCISAYEARGDANKISPSMAAMWDLDDAVEKCKQMELRFQTIGAGLVEVRYSMADNILDAKVEFIHQTAKEYLRQQSDPWECLMVDKNMAISINTYTMSCQLTLISLLPINDSFYTYNNDNDSSDEDDDDYSQIDTLESYAEKFFLLVARVEARTGKAQIEAIHGFQRVWTEILGVRYSQRPLHVDLNPTWLETTMAQAIHRSLYIWVGHQLRSWVFGTGLTERTEVPLLYYAIEAESPEEDDGYYSLGDYDGWVGKEPHIGPPDTAMVKVLLPYCGNINQIPEHLEGLDELVLKSQNRKRLWLTCLLWLALLQTILASSLYHTLPGPNLTMSGRAVRFRGDDIANEYLEIIKLFLDYGADISLSMRSNQTSVVPSIVPASGDSLLEAVSLKFKGLGEQEHMKFKIILWEHGVDPNYLTLTQQVCYGSALQPYRSLQRLAAEEQVEHRRAGTRPHVTIPTCIYILPESSNLLFPSLPLDSCI